MPVFTHLRLISVNDIPVAIHKFVAEKLTTTADNSEKIVEVCDQRPAPL